MAVEHYELKRVTVDAIVYDDLDKRQDIETFLGDRFEPELSYKEIIFYRDSDKYLNYMLFTETIYRAPGHDFAVMSNAKFKRRYHKVNRLSTAKA